MWAKLGRLRPRCLRCLEEQLYKRNVNFNHRNSSTNKSYEVVTELYKVSPAGHVPSHIEHPPYAHTGIVPDPPHSTEIKTEKQIALMRTACRTARKVLNTARDNIMVSQQKILTR